LPAPIVFGRTGGTRTDDAWTSTRREPRDESESAAREPKGERVEFKERCAGKTTKHEGSNWTVSECRSRSERMADRDAHERYQAPREHARSSSKDDEAARRRAPRRSIASESLRGPHDAPSNHGGTQGPRCARKPRRDRTRRGAGSRTREVLGPRARSRPVRRKGVRVVSRASLNQTRGTAALVSRVKLRCLTAHEASGSQGNGTLVIGALGATVTLRDRSDSGRDSMPFALLARALGGESAPTTRSSYVRSERRRYPFRPPSGGTCGIG